MVHPNHGIGSVREVVDMEISGECERFLVIDFHRTALSLRVPVRTLIQSGLRDVSSKETMKAALESLSGPPAVLSGPWSRRSALYAEKLKTGNPAMLAEILRDLTPAGGGWKAKLREEALIRMAEELALAEDIALDEAQQMIAACLAKDEKTPR